MSLNNEPQFRHRVTRLDIRAHNDVRAPDRFTFVTIFIIGCCSLAVYFLPISALAIEMPFASTTLVGPGKHLLHIADSFGRILLVSFCQDIRTHIISVLLK